MSGRITELGRLLLSGKLSGGFSAPWHSNVINHLQSVFPADVAVQCAMHLTANICLGCSNNGVCFSNQIGLPYSSDGDEVPLNLGSPLAAMLPSWVPSTSQQGCWAEWGMLWPPARRTQGWHTTSSLRAIWRLNFSYESLTWLDLNWVAGCIQKKEQDLVSFCSQGKTVNLTSHTYSHWTFVDLSQDVDLIAFPQISCEFPQKWLNTWHPRPQFNHRHSLAR